MVKKKKEEIKDFENWKKLIKYWIKTLVPSFIVYYSNVVLWELFQNEVLANSLTILSIGVAIFWLIPRTIIFFSKNIKFIWGIDVDESIRDIWEEKEND